MMLRKVLLLAGVALIQMMGGQAQTTGGTLTLRQAVETAITNNLTVKRTGLNMDRSEVGWKQSRGNLIPTLNVSINHNLNSGRSIDPNSNGYENQTFTSASYNLQSNVTLFNGLRLLNSIKRDQYAFEASRWEWQNSKDQLMLNVILAYLQILSTQDQLDQAVKQADVIQKQVDRLDIMNKEGATAPSTLADMKGQLASAQVTVINIQNSVNAAKLALAQYMNIPYDANLQVERVGVEQFDMNYGSSVDSIYQVAMQQLAIVKASDLRQKSAEKQVAASRGALYPSIGLGAGFSTNFSSTAKDPATLNKINYYDQLSNNYGSGVGIGINIPILNSFRAHNNVTLAKIDLKEAQYINQTTQIQLKQAIEQDYFNMTASLNRYKALADQVAAFTESFRAAEVRFNSGASTSVDYQIARNNLDAATINLIIARYDYLLRTKILDYYQNKALW